MIKLAHLVNIVPLIVYTSPGSLHQLEHLRFASFTHQSSTNNQTSL